MLRAPVCCRRWAATAEIFLKLVPLLDAKGLTTLEQARRASQRTHEARLRD